MLRFGGNNVRDMTAEDMTDSPVSCGSLCGFGACVLIKLTYCVLREAEAPVRDATAEDLDLFALS